MRDTRYMEEERVWASTAFGISTSRPNRNAALEEEPTLKTTIQRDILFRVQVSLPYLLVF